MIYKVNAFHLLIGPNWETETQTLDDPFFEKPQTHVDPQRNDI